MYNISNYNLARAIIKSICVSTNSKFIDVEVCFDEKDKMGFYDGKIYVGNPKTLSLALYRIISLYLYNFKSICDNDIFSNETHLFNVLNAVFNYIRYTAFSSGEIKVSIEKPFIQRLYQYDLIWLIMKDIICPAYERKIDNCKIILCDTPWMDISFFFKDEEDKSIILNSDINNKPVVYASLLCEVIKLHDLNVRDIFSEIINTEVMDKILGIAKLAFNDEEALDFIELLRVFSDCDGKIENILEKKDLKTAQSASMYSGQSTSANMGSSWWFLGLIEKLLEPARGSDWSTYRSLEPFYRELQDKIDKERKKVGREGLTYEALLRIQSGENDPEKIRVIEKNLASDRIW